MYQAAIGSREVAYPHELAAHGTGHRLYQQILPWRAKLASDPEAAPTAAGLI